ncbi:MAG: tRNA (N(6)-L-threonylcarbamoyladenosine(37)-C(2))-methylthiotransferase MtaB [Spirochaetales bacterium]|nr:tRNA (N(6)-L-threonylcarbamoyladenosine(37)-C(2))-methylthiotransferase MtaB [Spirochaetales bacterium]
MQAAFHTFGCRLNQLETEALADAFRHARFTIVPLSGDALVYVINTCTVTSKSEQKARGVIRRLNREHPRAVVIVTGCYAQMEVDLINSLGHNVFAVPLKEKDLIQDFALYLMNRPDEEGEELLEDTRAWFRDNGRTNDEAEARFRFVPDDFTYHTRAYLKIQDGCDNSCAYCRVTLARGASVSLALDKVIERVKVLEEKGFAEVTLTGVNIDSYRSGETDLAGLLEVLLSNTSAIRFRLSSLDPDTFTPALAKVVAHERVCPYFHLSVQSGSDRILQEMNRGYAALEVERAVELLRETKDNPFISADIIVGFPGEREENFTETLELMEKARFARAHVFPYSPRPGTPAFGRKDAVQESIISERTGRLREMMTRCQNDYGLSWEGRELDVVWEKEEGDFLIGLSGNYLSCRKKAGKGAELGECERVTAVKYGIVPGMMECDTQ